MTKGPLILAAFLTLTAPAHAAFISPVLEADDPAAAFVAPFEAEDEESAAPGFMILARESDYGETERRVESCAEAMQARDEGFTTLARNATPLLDDWAFARCEALNYLQGVKPAATQQPAPLEPAWIARLPAFVSEASSCSKLVAALRATLRDETWLAFEAKAQGTEGPAKLQSQPPAQFDHLVESRRPSGTLAVTAGDENTLKVYLNAANGAIERLAELDFDGDGTDDLLVLIRWEADIVGTYRQEVMRLKGQGSGKPYRLMDQAAWLARTIETCPDNLAEVLAGPAELEN